MEVHGKPKGLHKYWENKITVPASYELGPDDNKDNKDKGNTPSVDKPTTTPTATITTTATASNKPTPLHSTTPLALEYKLWESVVLLSVLINIIDMFGSGIDLSGKAHTTWKLLEAQYGRVSDHTRNMHEDALASCKMLEGGKVAGEGGHIEKMHTLRKLANNTGTNIKR